MIRIRIPRFAGAGALALVACCSDAAVPVQLNTVQHTTFVSRGLWGPNGLDLESRATESGLFLTDSLISGSERTRRSRLVSDLQFCRLRLSVA